MVKSVDRVNTCLGNLDNKKGITLIALIITIIVLLILAGVSIITISGENGILKRGTNATVENNKQKYFEDIKIEVMNEQIERASKTKDEAFIKSVYNRLVGNEKLEGKSWVYEAVMCNAEFETQEDDYANTLLVITTKDKYQIFVDFNNHTLSASIQEDNYEIGQYYMVSYDSNTGSGNIDSQRVYGGVSCTLATNTFTKEDYNFIGWCKDKDGNGEIYSEGTKIEIEEDTILYAIWQQKLFTITFNSNEGTGTMEPLKVEKNVAGTLPANTFTKSGLEFSKWNTKPDGTGESYVDAGSITVENNITLYAIWVTPFYIYNQGAVSGYPLTVGTPYTNKYISLSTNYISYNSQTNNYLYCTTSIPNNYTNLCVRIKSVTKGYSWSACRIGVRPIYGSDGSNSFTNYGIPGDWYKQGLAATSTSKDSTYRIYNLDLSSVTASSYYFFLHTAGQNWTINKIWFY